MLSMAVSGIILGFSLSGPAQGEEPLVSSTLQASTSPSSLSSLSSPSSSSQWWHPGYWLQAAGFGFVLGSQVAVEASSSRDVLFIGGLAAFTVGTVALLLDPPSPAIVPKSPGSPPALLPVPGWRPVPVWTPPPAIHSLKSIKGLNVREGIEVERLAVAFAAPLLGYDDRTVISPSTKADQVLTWMADSYKATGRSILTLVVHISPSNDPEGDRRLGQSRGEALMSVYVDREGIERDRVTTVSAGGSQPLVESTHPEAEKINARVEARFQRAASTSLRDESLDRLLRAPGVQVRRDLEAVESVILATEEAVLFDVNSARPTTSSDRALEKISEVLKEMVASPGAVTVRIEGHTDGAGDPTYNKKLSLERAQAVVKYFTVTRQLPLAIFEPVGHGSATPLVENTTPENRAKNRRVQIFIKKSVVPDP